MDEKGSIIKLKATIITLIFCVLFSFSALAEDELTRYYNELDRSCKVDADCVVKDIHNCCGYYPSCINKEAEVNPEYVREICVKLQMDSICGFPHIESCHCHEGYCEKDR